mmetsp:Transcript_24860/g.54195  ORF Transcript_24860/g.54195 Transcript_24860/m.54195 type:complete len:213 (-) Transcript_24860:771-1409(-)
MVSLRCVVACHRPHVVVAPEARRRGQRGWTPDAWRNTHNESLFVSSQMPRAVFRMAAAQKFSGGLLPKLETTSCHVLMSPGMDELKLFVGICTVAAGHIEILNAGNHVFTLLWRGSRAALRDVILQICKVGTVRQIAPGGIATARLHGALGSQDLWRIRLVILEGELRLYLIHRGIGARELLRQKDAVLTAAVATLIRSKAAGSVLLLNQLL